MVKDLSTASMGAAWADAVATLLETSDGVPLPDVTERGVKRLADTFGRW